MRLSYLDVCDVYRRAYDSSGADEYWQMRLVAVGMKIAQLSVDRAARLGAGLVLPLQPTHTAHCEVASDITSDWDRALIVRRQDGAQYLVIRTQFSDRRRGGKCHLQLLLNATEGELVT